MSHDIRTPMNVIMGFTNIALQHADDSDKMKECLEKIRVSGSNLQELIDDVLDISRIESGEFKIVSQPVKLSELFDFYCQAIAGMAEAKNIRFSGKLHDISHNVLLSDQIRLGQIYMNLLSNAVKYTPENGDVKFEVYEEKLAGSGKVRLVSVVSDTGIGMTPEFMEQMYSAFSRAVDTRVNKVRGSGLGLAIVKKIVDLMGGAIGAESKVGKGEDVDKMRNACEKAKALMPDTPIGGEFQFDAAVSPAVAKTKHITDAVGGHANTFIFPDINAGNIGYKIAQRLGGFEAYGPILQGLNAPINDLSRGCNAQEVYSMAIITAALA